MKDLKEKAIKGGLAKACSQGTTVFLRVGSLMVLGRLLSPKEFGLVGMVTAVIGVLSLFRDFGLSTATVQREYVSEDQLSTLFWINLFVGGILALFSVGVAPLVARFYNEPRLVAVTTVLALGFIFNAAGVQHGALLQRQMRFTAMAIIETVSLFGSTTLGIIMALRGFGYWSLVAMTVSASAISSVCVWIACTWIPGMPRKGVGVRSMMRFGGTITVNSLVVYVAYNLEKVLLGRFWGADAIGIYGRAYQLITIPTDNLNSSIGGVAFSALSRIQNDPERLKSYFLKGYSLVLTLTLPITFACALFAPDVIFVVLGPKWKDAAAIFRLLAPTILIFAIINPLAWLLFSIGMVARSLKIVLVLAPLVIIGYLIGLPHGPQGVAFAYSLVMTLWVVPHVYWCVHGTMISFRDITLAVGRPLLSGILAAGVSLAAQVYYGPLLAPLPRLILGGTILLGVYVGMLFYVMGQKTIYLDLLRNLRRRPTVEEKALVSA